MLTIPVFLALFHFPDPSDVYAGRVVELMTPAEWTLIVQPMPRGAWRTEWYADGRLRFVGVLWRTAGGQFREILRDQRNSDQHACSWCLAAGELTIRFDRSIWAQASKLRYVDRLP